jgi:hypothetical protein
MYEENYDMDSDLFRITSTAQVCGPGPNAQYNFVTSLLMSRMRDAHRNKIILCSLIDLLRKQNILNTKKAIK